MPLSSEAQALFDHAKQSLPRWLTGAASAALEWMYGFTEIMDEVRVQGQDWLDITLLENAVGVELDQHAADRGTSRRVGETDAVLRERLRQITDALTEPALKAGVDAILAGLGTCAIVCLRRDRGHFHTNGTCTAFFNRGYRMGNEGRPMAYIIILPFGSTEATANAVSEYLRQTGPAGYIYYVERRLVP